MNKQALIGCLSGLALAASAQADTLPFFNVQFETTAIALTADGPVGLDALSGAWGGEVVSVSADSIGVTDVATAGAVVGSDLLTTSSDVSATGVGSAIASTQFSGSFINGAAVALNLDFTSMDASNGTGTSATTLFVSLTSNGVTLFENFVQGPWAFSYLPAVGTTSVLSLTLSSESSAAFPTLGAGNASAFGMVGIAGTVPEASSWLMFGLGLTAVAAVRTRASRRRVSMA